MKTVSSHEELLQKTGKETMKVNRLRILTGKKHRQTAPRKSTNMGVWAVGILNQLFIRGS